MTPPDDRPHRTPQARNRRLTVVGLATTGLSTVITDGVDGFVGHDVDRLVHVMHVLLDDADLAHRIGAAGRATAPERFSLQRFVHDREIVLDRVAARTPP